MTTPSVPPPAAALLDFIAVKESSGNYDAYIGHADADTGTITGKSILDVYAFQRQLVASGEPSSAVGRYQFVQRTLNGVVQQRGINPAAYLLSAGIQDDLALTLLENRGYRSWLSGGLTDEQFAHNLSCEWASLPDPLNGGRSHYDGDGVNHAGRTLDEVYAMLAAAKAA